MELAERFDYLMNVIDRWTGRVSDKNAGAFRYLREGMWAREIAVTPGCSISAAQMKTYLATAVLEIYPFNTNAKVSYRDIRRFLSGEAAKKYSFDFQKLERYFSAEGNRETAGRSRLLKELAEAVKDWGNVSPCLLERLQELFWIRLRKYWLMCDPETEQPSENRGRKLKWKQRPDRRDDYRDDSEKDEELLAEKQNRYVECLIILALREIFVREYGQEYEKRFQESSQRQAAIRAIREDMAAFAQNYANGSEDERKLLLENCRTQTRKAEECVNWFAGLEALQLLCMEHTIGIEAEIQLIMILEIKKLENIKLNTGLGWNLSKCLEIMEDRWTESFTRWNKNKSRIYHQLEADMENIFSRYLERLSMPAQKEVFRAVKAYFRIVEKGKPDERQRQELWKIQCILARPLWQYRPDSKPMCGDRCDKQSDS